MPDNIKEYQHVVPVLHLRHFSKNGIVQVRDIWTGIIYPKNIHDVGGTKFIYDYNTMLDTSMESILEMDEKRFGKAMDDYIQGNTEVSSKFLIEYLCMLISRSYSVVESACDYILRCIRSNKTIFDHMPLEEREIWIVNAFRKLIKKYYMNRSSLLNGKDPSSFEAKVVESDSTCEFITSDIPFYHRNVYGGPTDTDPSIFSNDNNWIWICPISSKKCIIVSRKGQFEENPMIKLIMTMNKKRIM